ncbi:hypothetical protein H6G96_17860 [Nostoc sp. FACHB-892]|uniref:hypothetical protein n=1 Tax=Nostoc sp. FACHB-892 TaxID=2692843 RepID=UPI001682BC27|nr:hypothetical protein [Nostoc sp. FACHB-892]MBD2728135.1 hypothetical protein [Nostoc sp. FACHB-892]
MVGHTSLGREFLTNLDAKQVKAQLETGENSICQPDFNKGQLLPAVLLLISCVLPLRRPLRYKV